jgi:hypothetical protein
MNVQAVRPCDNVCCTNNGFRGKKHCI